MEYTTQAIKLTKNEVAIAIQKLLEDNDCEVELQVKGFDMKIINKIINKKNV